MATRHLWILATIGVGWGMLFFVVGRLVVRALLDVPSLVAQIPGLSATIQLVAFGAVAVLAIGAFIALGRFFDVHKM